MSALPRILRGKEIDRTPAPILEAVRKGQNDILRAYIKYIHTDYRKIPPLAGTGQYIDYAVTSAISDIIIRTLEYSTDKQFEIMLDGSRKVSPVMHGLLAKIIHKIDTVKDAAGKITYLIAHGASINESDGHNTVAEIVIANYNKYVALFPIIFNGSEQISIMRFRNARILEGALLALLFDENIFVPAIRDQIHKLPQEQLQHALNVLLESRNSLVRDILHNMVNPDRKYAYTRRLIRNIHSSTIGTVEKIMNTVKASASKRRSHILTLTRKGGAVTKVFTVDRNGRCRSRRRRGESRFC